MNLFVFRHGNVLNPDNLVYLRMDKEIKLSPLGERQIATQSEKLKNKIENHQIQPIQAIYHSPLYRTAQSAHIIEKTIQTQHIYPEPKLIEVGSPAQGMTFAKFTQKYQANLYTPELIAQGGETLLQIAQRLTNLIEQLNQQYTDQNIILVSHGDPIKVLWLIADKIEINHQNMGSDIYPSTVKQYPEKGSLSIFQYEQKELSRTDYWPPISK